jgi:hypothetical protein
LAHKFQSRWLLRRMPRRWLGTILLSSVCSLHLVPAPVKNDTVRRVGGHMKSSVFALASTALLLTSCSPILREVRHPGGYPGYLLDKRTFDASRSKKLQLLRTSIILAMAARMGTATIRDGKEADAFADYLTAATDEINYAAANVYGAIPAGGIAIVPPCRVGVMANNPTNCQGYYALFESDMPMIEARITRVMLAALPEDRVRKFIGDVAKGNVLSAAWSAIKAVGEATGGLHRSAGVYRTGLEAVAANVADCEGKTDTFAEDTQTVHHAAECMGLSHNSLFDNDSQIPSDKPNLEVKIDALTAMLLLVQTSCARLPVVTDSGKTSDRVKARGDVCEKIRG